MLASEREVLDRVRDDVERVAFAPESTAPLDDRAVLEVRRAILASADGRQRARALLLPPSLIGGGAQEDSEADAEARAPA